MRTRSTTVLGLLALVAACAGSARADAVADGLNAVTRGDYAAARAIWMTVAEPGKGQPGDARAQYFMGVIYEQGNGVPQDISAATHWFGLSAAQGDKHAQNNLGEIYYHGRGVPVDLKRALGYFEQAAGQGDAEGEFALGLMLARGEALPVNMPRAYIMFSRAIPGLSGTRKAEATYDKVLAGVNLSPGELMTANKAVAAKP